MVIIDEIYVVACPKSELQYDEEAEKERAHQRILEKLEVKPSYFVNFRKLKIALDVQLLNRTLQVIPL